MFIILIILLTIFMISYIAYHMAFYTPNRSDEKDFTLPEGESYRKHHPAILKSIERMKQYSYEEIYIKSFDRTKLFARYYHNKDGAPLQIHFHGYKSSAFLDFCGGNHLARQIDHNVLVVDQRSHGKSEGNTITFGIKERKDCLCWIEYARIRFGNDIPIILCGLSMGAATVLMAADLPLTINVKGIIADCPYSSPKAIIQKVSADMHLPAKLLYPFVRLGAWLFGGFNLEESDAVTAVSKTRIPILLFHGDADRFVPCQMSFDIRNACASPVTLVTVPEAGHGLCYMVDPQTYENTTFGFIDKVLHNKGDLSS